MSAERAGPRHFLNHSRRSLLLALAGIPFAPLAFAQARAALPGGGSVAVPSPFLVKTSYPNYADRAPDATLFDASDASDADGTFNWLRRVAGCYGSFRPDCLADYFEERPRCGTTFSAGTCSASPWHGA